MSIFQYDSYLLRLKVALYREKQAQNALRTTILPWNWKRVATPIIVVDWMKDYILRPRDFSVCFRPASVIGWYMSLDMRTPSRMAHHRGGVRKLWRSYRQEAIKRMAAESHI